MKKSLFFLSILSFLGTSCRNTPPCASHQTVDNQIWTHKQTFDFEVNIIDTTCFHTFACCIRHSDGFLFPSIPIAMQITGPNGDTEIGQYLVKITNEKGEFLGEGMGDIWDYCHPIDSLRFTQAGIYRFRIAHIFPQNNVPLVMEVGLEVGKVEKK
ncbi:MAG: hypothetical protein ACKVTZ_11115 [Bacteroidia bacterium]